MREFPFGTQILQSPPPTHALHGRYFGRIAVLPDFTEELLDPSLMVEDPAPAVAESDTEPHAD